VRCGWSHAVEVHDADGDGGGEAVEAEEVPAAGFEPAGEPAEGEEAGGEGEEHAEEAGEEGGGEGIGGAAGGEDFVAGLEEAGEFMIDDGGGEDDGEGEGEGFDAGFGGAGEHAGGDGGAGAGEAAEGKAEALDGADDARLLEGEFGGVRGFGVGGGFCGAFFEAGEEDEDAGGGEGGGDEVEAVEELFDFGFLLAFAEEVFDGFDDGVADDGGEGGGEDDAESEGLEGAFGGEEGALPLFPEVEDDGEHGAGVEHDEEEGVGGGFHVFAEEFGGDDDVGGAGDGEELGEALDDGEDEDVEEVHEFWIL
jgi:hypothetical protein